MLLPQDSFEAQREKGLRGAKDCIQSVVDHADYYYGRVATQELAKTITDAAFRDVIASLLKDSLQIISDGDVFFTARTGEQVSFSVEKGRVVELRTPVDTISQETRLEIVSIFNTARISEFVNREMNDPEISQHAENSELSAAKHMNRTAFIASLFAQQDMKEEDLLAKARFVIAAGAHDVGKFASEVMTLRESQKLTKEEYASIYEHSSQTNPLINVLPNGYSKYIAFSHHSMPQEKKDFLAQQGIHISITSHDVVQKEAEQVSGIDKRSVIEDLIRIKCIDVMDAMLSFRSYRAFTVSFSHAMHEALKKVAEMDPQGEFTEFTRNTLDFFFRNIQTLTWQHFRTKEAFLERVEHEKDVVANRFHVGYEVLASFLEKFSQKSENPLYRYMLQDLVQRSGEETKAGASLEESWIEVCSKLGIHLRSNKDIRLMQEQDFLLTPVVAQEALQEMQGASYDEMIAMFQIAEEKILAEGRRDEFIPNITEEQRMSLEKILGLTEFPRPPFGGGVGKRISPAGGDVSSFIARGNFVVPANDDVIAEQIRA